MAKMTHLAMSNWFIAKETENGTKSTTNKPAIHTLDTMLTHLHTV